MDVFAAQDIKSAINRLTLAIHEIQNLITKTTLAKTKLGIVLHTRMQTLFGIKFETALERSLHELIIEHAIKAEQIGPGGFDKCIQMIIKGLSLRNTDSLLLNTRMQLGSFSNHGATVPTMADVMQTIEKYSEGSTLPIKDIVIEALNLAGFGGRIVIEKTEFNIPSIELIQGYTFDHSPAWPINVKLENPRIFCIDGFIEEVSEIHHLLESFSETKEHGILFVRGMSNDVIHTLKVNYDRGSLRVIPVIVKFDLEGINSLNDITIATGSELVSSNKGDVINNIKFHLATKVNEALIYPNKVAITHPGSAKAVASHINFLRSKRQDEKIADVAKLIDARIKSLSPNHVVIRIPDDKDCVINSQAIDYTLRAIKSLVEHGIIIVDDKRELAATLVSSKIYSERCCEMLTSLGSVIISSSQDQVLP